LTLGRTSVKEDGLSVTAAQTTSGNGEAKKVRSSATLA
jgi:hypothetical protein